jgi:hypothetical protein
MIDHVVREVVAADSGINVGAKRIATGENRGTAVRAGRHRPHVVELDPGVREGIDVGSRRRVVPAVAEHLPLVDAEVVNDDKEDIWWRCIGSEDPRNPSEGGNQG